MFTWETRRAVINNRGNSAVVVFGIIHCKEKEKKKILIEVTSTYVTTTLLII